MTPNYQNRLTHGMVNQVAPNMNVYEKMKKAAAAPYCAALSGLSLSSRAKAPAKISEIPWPMAPQYKPIRRPHRSMVTTAISVLNMYVIYRVCQVSILVETRQGKYAYIIQTTHPLRLSCRIASLCKDCRSIHGDCSDTNPSSGYVRLENRTQSGLTYS